MKTKMTYDGAWTMETHHHRSDESLYASNQASVAFLIFSEIVGIFDFLHFIFLMWRKKIHPEYFTVLRTSLSFNCIVQMVSTPAMLAALMSSGCTASSCETLVLAWFMSRRCGIILHLLVALEYMLIKKKHPLASKLQCMHFTLPIVLTLNFVGSFFSSYNAVAIIFDVLGLILTCLLSFHACNRRVKMDKHLLLVYVFALISYNILHFPSFIAECLILATNGVSLSEYMSLMCLGNLRMLLDGQLRRIISSEPPEKTLHVPESERLNPPFFINVNVTNDAGESAS